MKIVLEIGVYHIILAQLIGEFAQAAPELAYWYLV